jgi:hypothetical protein
MAGSELPTGGASSSNPSQSLSAQSQLSVLGATPPMHTKAPPMHAHTPNSHAPVLEPHCALMTCEGLDGFAVPFKPSGACPTSSV